MKLSIPALLILASIGVAACAPTEPVSFHPKGGAGGDAHVPGPHAFPSPSATPPIDEGDPSFAIASVNPTTLTVPPGGGKTLRVSVERIDGHDGEIEITLLGLPVGVSAEPVVMTGADVEADVVVSATDDTAILEPVEAFVRAQDVDGSRSQGFRVQVRGNDGDLDHSFGAANGIAVLPASGAAGVEVMADGRSVVASASAGGIVVMRLTASGGLDATFGTAGATEVLLGPGTATQVADLVVLADGGVLVAGTVVRSSPEGFATSDVVLVRLDPQGALTSGFGVKFLDLAPAEAATSLVTDATGVVVAGVAHPADSGSQVFLARTSLADGALDPAFGAGSGVVLEPGMEARYALARAPGGKLVLSGATRTTRFLDDGTRDTTFGAGGDAITSSDGTSRAVTVQPDGKVLVAASHLGSPVVVRYLVDGTPDPAFGDAGMTEIAGAGRVDALITDAAGRIVGAGRAGGDVAAFRLLAGGAFDPSFAGGEVIRHDAGGIDAATGLAVHGDGRLLVSGESTSADAPVNGFLLRLWAAP